MSDTSVSSPRSYGRLARVLHWTTAALVVLLGVSGVVMTLELAPGSGFARLRAGLPLYDLHKAMGLIVLALVLVRIVNRILRGTPPVDPTLPLWRRQLAPLVQGWLYLLLVVVPLLGWLGISLFPALNLFGVVAVPGLVAPDRALTAGVFLIHAALAYALLVIAGVHAAAALHNHFVRRDATLRRMLGPADGA
jgi:cytochrome b561